MMMKMETTINNIPVSLYKPLSDKLVSIILDSKEKNSVSTELTKKIIYLWRQDQLATPTGLETLLSAAVIVDEEATVDVLEELGLHELTVAIKNL